MGDALVVIEITLVNGGIDNAAELVWVSDAGDEQKYTDIVARATVKQETFAGHRWMVRGLRSRQVLLRIEAQPHPALQQFQIDVDAEPPSADDDDAAAATEEDAQMDAVDTEANPAEEGAWIGGEGLCQFVRVPPRRGGPVVWRELDVDGNEAGRLTQLDARVDTRWLWWASSLYKRTMSMSADKEYLIMSCLSIAGAYHLDFELPQWLSTASGGRLGPNPFMLLLLISIIGGAVIAAAVPLRESTVLLYNAATRQEPTYARAIADGTKTVEGRPRSGWATSVSKDDYVRFNISNKGPKLVVRVLEVRTYPTFDAMLEDCAVSACLPGHTGTRADAVRVYRSFASSSGTYDELEAKVGVVAMDVVPLVAPEDEDDEGEGAGDLAGETVTDEPITAHEHERGGGSAHAGGVGAPAAVEQPVWAEEDDGFGW